MSAALRFFGFKDGGCTITRLPAMWPVWDYVLGAAVIVGAAAIVAAAFICVMLIVMDLLPRALVLW